MTKLVGLSWIVIGSLSAGSSQAEGVVTGSGGGFEPLGPMTVGAGGATAAVTGGAALDVVDPFDVDPSLPAAAGPPVVDLGECLVGLRQVVALRFLPCRRVGVARHGAAWRWALRTSRGIGAATIAPAGQAATSTIATAIPSPRSEASSERFYGRGLRR